MVKKVFILFSFICPLMSCEQPIAKTNFEDKEHVDSMRQAEIAKLKAEELERSRPIQAQEIILKKDLLYNKYTLDDEYSYKTKKRKFQWDKIKEKLAAVETFQKQHKQYAVISNYKNKNGEAATVEHAKRNSYNRITDSLGVERYQSVPLYPTANSKKPLLYGRDGTLVSIIDSTTNPMVKVKGLTNTEGEWYVPKQYIKSIGDTLSFKHIVIIDVTNQNITALEHLNNEWIIRSMNPATTGKYNPPYGMVTPVGIFVLQEQKPKMFYYRDGTTSIQGYAPWASRFTNGAYIHGVPTSDPKAPIIEYSSTLGTTPRSHMCVRNASSHAKFIYNWIKPNASLVVIID